MYEIGIEGLQQLLEDARVAAKYAWDNYDTIATRQHSHTLYGPYCYRIGASVPSAMTPISARKLVKSTRRKDHLIYELDDKYRVLRTKSVMNHTQIECVYHHFDLNDVIYAYPFNEDRKEMYNDTINVIKFADGVPIYYGVVSRKFLFAQFYEYTEPEKMLVSTYRFYPNAEYTMYGYPVDWNAPVGALNSPVDRYCKEEVSEYIDFSCWFK